MHTASYKLSLVCGFFDHNYNVNFLSAAGETLLNLVPIHEVLLVVLLRLVPDMRTFEAARSRACTPSSLMFNWKGPSEDLPQA